MGGFFSIPRPLQGFPVFEGASVKLAYTLAVSAVRAVNGLLLHFVSFTSKLLDLSKLDYFKLNSQVVISF